MGKFFEKRFIIELFKIFEEINCDILKFAKTTDFPVDLCSALVADQFQKNIHSLMLIETFDVTFHLNNMFSVFLNTFIRSLIPTRRSAHFDSAPSMS